MKKLAAELAPESSCGVDALWTVALTNGGQIALLPVNS